MILHLLKRPFKLPLPRMSLYPDPAAESYRGLSGSAGFPLDSESPWPKFRANPLQNGRSSVTPAVSNAAPWEVMTANGVFSTPVIDGDGTVYIGSGDHLFYAFAADGRELWHFATRDIIDSSALLDDQGRVFLGSGDGHVYSLDRNTGLELWRFRAHSTLEVREQYGVKPHNLNWFRRQYGSPSRRHPAGSQR